MARRSRSDGAVRFDADGFDVLSNPIPVLDGVASLSGGAHVDLSDDGALVYRQGGRQADARTLVWVDRQGNEEGVPAEARPYQLSAAFLRRAVGRHSGAGPRQQ